MKYVKKCWMISVATIVGIGAVFTWILCVAFANGGICFRTVAAFVFVHALEILLAGLLPSRWLAEGHSNISKEFEREDN